MPPARIDVALLLLVAACSKPATHVRPLELAQPSTRWGQGAFVALEPALRLPTSPNQRDRIVIWLALPEGGKITTAHVREGSHSLY